MLTACLIVWTFICLVYVEHYIKVFFKIKVNKTLHLKSPISSKSINYKALLFSIKYKLTISYFSNNTH